MPCSSMDMLNSKVKTSTCPCGNRWPRLTVVRSFQPNDNRRPRWWRVTGVRQPSGIQIFSLINQHKTRKNQPLASLENVGRMTPRCRCVEKNFDHTRPRANSPFHCSAWKRVPGCSRTLTNELENTFLHSLEGNDDTLRFSLKLEVGAASTPRYPERKIP